MRVIANIAPGPAWLAGRSVYEQGEPIGAHLRAAPLTRSETRL
jgi:hypothetical protein